MLKLPKNQSGQALLIVVLSLAVVLTIVLSILARSVTDIKISTGGEESLRAFSAAEAGVERALIAGGSVSCTQESCPEFGGATFNASVTEIGEGSNYFINPSPLFSGETAIFWFVAHDAGGNLVCDLNNNCFTGDTIRVCWAKQGTGDSSPETPAVEASVVYTETPGDYSTLKVARQTADPNTTRRADNNFGAAANGCTIGTENYAFRATLTLSGLGIPSSSYNNPDGLQFLMLRMVYNQNESHTAGISVDFPNNGVLPAQGTLVESLGTAAQGGANRKINVFQGFGEPPLPFGVVVFSPTGITK